MKLDFRGNGMMDSHCAELFNIIARNAQYHFTEAIDSVSECLAHKIDWYVSSPASRNLLGSSLFFYCCCIELLVHLLKKNCSITEIKTDSTALTEIIKTCVDAYHKDVRIVFVPESKKACRKRVFNIFRTVLIQLQMHSLARFTRRLGKRLPQAPVILIDTFVMPGFIDKNRYYGEMDSALECDEKRLLWYVPTLIGYKKSELHDAIKNIRNSDRNFLLKEDYLKLSDYVYALTHIFRVRKLRIAQTEFNGRDISPLIKEEIWSFRGYGLSFKALLNYRFARRLRDAGIKIRLVINWFENQVIDKGWNAGFNRSFPSTPSKGYQGFVIPSNYMWLSPSRQEGLGGVTPKEISVSGKGTIPIVKRFYPKLNTSVAPAIRYGHVWKARKFYPDPSCFIILVPLHLVMREILRILRILADISRNLDNDTVRWWIKPHPAMSAKKIMRSAGKDWPDSFEIVTGSFRDVMERAHLVVGNTSSTCLETLATGTPVIVLANSGGFTFNPIPENLDETIWTECWTGEDVLRVIKYYQKRYWELKPDHERIGRKIRRQYFEPISSFGIRRLLCLDNSKACSNNACKENRLARQG